MNVCVTGAGPLRTAKGGDTLTENTLKTMDMYTTKEDKKYQPQGGRIPQGSAQDPSIVPAGPASSSGDGQAKEKEKEREIPKTPDETGSCSLSAENTENPKTTTDTALELAESIVERIRDNSPPPEEAPKTVDDKDEESASVISGSTAMECDEVRATKRKISRSAERGPSEEESDDEKLSRVKFARRRRIMSEEGIVQKEQSRSNPDLHLRSSEEDPNIVMLKKGYISKQKKLEIEEAKEEIAAKKREENRRRREERKRLEEETRKKEERVKVEAMIMSKITAKSSEETDYIHNMTASDLAAMALEYLDHVEIIRTKCGTMQGALSGELKRRKLNLDNMVRALHVKAEEKGDPKFLRAKIEELLKKNREEEDKRKKEINELRETVTSLTKENKLMREENRLMREELKSIRESLEKKEYLPKKDLPRKERSRVDPAMSHEDRRRCPSLISLDDGPVMRPPLKGRSDPIPNSNLQQRKTVKKEEKTKKPEIKIISNVQIKPPRGKERMVETGQEDEVVTNNMEWEEDGHDWYEEGMTEDRIQSEEKNREDIQEGKKVQEDRKVQEESWVTVVKRGKKIGQKKKEKVVIPANKSSKQQLIKEVKRKPPKTAAVSIKGDTTKGFSYADVLRKARSHIKMEDLQIDAPKIRKGLNGATIIEISGPECNDKAKRLADKLQDILREDNASITTPTIKGELRLVGLDESISKEEIAWAIEEEGGCVQKEIRIGEIKRTRRGMGVAWVQCPLKSAVEIARKKKIKVGWTIVGVILLKARPIQCFRCWHHGHVKDSCRSQIDRSRSCFQCGKDGHGIAACKNAIKCAVCDSLGRDSAHRVGSIKCEGVTLRPPRNVEPSRRTDTAIITD